MYATNAKNIVFAGEVLEDAECLVVVTRLVAYMEYAMFPGTWHYSSSVTGSHVLPSMLGVGLSINIGAK